MNYMRQWEKSEHPEGRTIEDLLEELWVSFGFRRSS